MIAFLLVILFFIVGLLFWPRLYTMHHDWAFKKRKKNEKK